MYVIVKGNASSGSVLYLCDFNIFYSNSEIKKNGAKIKEYKTYADAETRIKSLKLKLHNGKSFVRHDECYPVEKNTEKLGFVIHQPVKNAQFMTSTR